MKKASYIIVLFISLFISLSTVHALRGDLNYEITNVTIVDDVITIEGWAFIHRTHNYVTVYERTASGIETTNIVKKNGGQKVKIKLEDSNGKKLEKEYKNVNTPNGYNFYYQMFYKAPSATSGQNYYDVSTYNNTSLNKCSNTQTTQCYYEDLGFSITFSLDEIYEHFSPGTELSFSIAAYNNDYGKYTGYSPIKIVDMDYNSDFIDITAGNPNGELKFIGVEAILRNLDGSSTSKTNEMIGVCSDNSNNFCDSKKSTYYIFDYDNGSYTNGFVSGSNNGLGGKNFLNGTKSSGLYAICVVKNGTGYLKKQAPDACSKRNSNNYCTECSDGKLLATYSSWVALVETDQLQIKLKDIKKCDVTNPLPNNLNCNSNGILSSTCEELTVITDEGIADVKIEQTGIVSSVLTPDSIHSGGGFKFGIMYYNTIKWSYVRSKPNNKLHDAITEEMNKKIKDYESYIVDVKLENLKFGDYDIESGMVKTCTTSNENKDYYDKELTVSCVFTFPDSSVDLNGNINYSNVSSSSLNINNKYYTPMDKYGNFNISVTITGMDRITESSSKDDSADENNKPWTGTWTDSIDGCVINVYPLYYNKDYPDSVTNDVYNFIYRPIDIYNPFPNRNAGINWFDWYNVRRNKERLESTYDSGNIEYKVTLDNNAIADIKNYNKNHNYLEWDSINKETGKSSFITDKNYIDRVGGN